MLQTFKDIKPELLDINNFKSLFDDRLESGCMKGSDKLLFEDDGL